LAARLKPIEDEREIRDDLYLIVFSVHIEAVRRQHDDTEACESRSASLAASTCTVRGAGFLAAGDSPAYTLRTSADMLQLSSRSPPAVSRLGAARLLHFDAEEDHQTTA
jgi:hypothetical protein